MAIGRYLLHVLAAFLVYSVLYSLVTMVIFGDLYRANAEMMRGPSDPLALYAMAGYVLQTAFVVALFNMAVASSDIVKGAKFGLLMGGYLAATDMATYFGLKLSVAPLPVSIILHLAVGAIVGMVLAKLNGLGTGKAEQAPA